MAKHIAKLRCKKETTKRVAMAKPEEEGGICRIF